MQVKQQGWVVFVEAVVPPAHLVWVGVTTQAPGEDTNNFSIIFRLYKYMYEETTTTNTKPHWQRRPVATLRMGWTCYGVL